EKDVPVDRWDGLLQAIDKFGREPREKTAEKLGKLADPVFTTLRTGRKNEKLGKFVDGLRVFGLADFVSIDIGIVRGLAYYIGIVIAKEERRADALKQIQQLRDRGYRVDYPLAPTKVARQFQAAEEAGASLAVLYGDEWPQLKIKNMTTGEQELIPQENLKDYIAAD